VTEEARMIDAPSAAQVYLHPGQLFVTAEPATVTTILGSCVSVCLWDATSRVAGINHFLLPKNPMPGNDDARYGDTAMDALFVALWKKGAAFDRLVAKIFGGASVLHGAATSRSIGDQNAVIARAVLQRHGITAVAEQIGGVKGRKLLFDATDGSAWIKEI
jgi:chemotaxis protein CheD